ncbi:hypothetical protein [Paraburkholderia sacchari]|uniref:hypothetical protein n=1 Tax=Paraburkholderia sacchari TaxID=159450 RepID=UPI001BD19C1C|nr:hypothetical protein [Paraburkholderia sacchari]
MGTKIQKAGFMPAFFVSGSSFPGVRLAVRAAEHQHAAAECFAASPRADADLSRCEDFLKTLIDRVREHAIIAV